MMRTHATVGLMLALAGAALGQEDASWINPDGGVWFNQANWSGGVVPNNNGDSLFNATLDLQDQPYVVLVDDDVQIENFSLLWSGATLDLGLSSFAVNQSMAVVRGAVVGSGKAGAVSVGGELLLDDAVLMNAGTITSRGTTTIASNGGTIVCSTGVDHRGPEMRFEGRGDLTIEQGGSISNGSLSTLTIATDGDKLITGDSTGTLQNDGLLLNGDTGRGQAGTTSINGVNFINRGTVTVGTGALIINSVNDLVPDGVLSQGVWNIRDGSRLSLGESDIRELSAAVNISGPDAVFSNIDRLARVREGGRFSISDARDFVAADQFSNGGEVEVGEGSTFDASQGLGNLDGDAIFGGSFIVAGDFLTGADSIRLLESDLVLSGQNARFQGIEAIERVGSSGRFALQNGRVFETAGDLDVEQGGRVRVGVGSALSVSGQLLSNDDGVLGVGGFEVAGTLSAQNLRITEIDTDLTLIGEGSLILNADGSNALSGLNLIARSGELRLRDGRSIIGLNNLTVENLLSIDGADAPAGDAGPRISSPGTVLVGNNLTFTETSTLELLINGRDAGLYGRVIAGTTDVFDGATLSLIVDPDAGLAFGDSFLLLDTTLLEGRFTNILVIGLDEGLRFEIDQTTSGIFARVVPSPGVLAIFAASGLVGVRRRR